MILIPLSIAGLVSGLLCIRANYRQSQRQFFFFKPLTTALIILLALLAPLPTNSLYKWLILAGLLFSLAGDIFLMLPRDRFVAGLISFLIAHLVYIVAFSLEADWLLSSWGIAPLLYGVLMSAVLLPGLKGKLKIAVMLYILVILAMAWRALEWWAQISSASSALALAGALFFVASDSALALNRFRRPFHSAQAIVLSTYYLAQWFIALSIWPG